MNIETIYLEKEKNHGISFHCARKNLSGKICQEKSVRKNLSGKICQEKSVRKNLSGKICQEKSVRKNLSAGLALSACALLGSGGSVWAQSTHEVQANEHYFQGAVLGRWTNAAPGCPTGAAYSNVPASIGGVLYTVTSNAGDKAGYCANQLAGTDIPGGNNTPSVDWISMRTNTVTLKTAGTPFPMGTVLALHDVDVDEIVDITFESCDGTALNTQNFTYVVISANAPALPTYSVASSGVWTVTAAVHVNSPTVGIQMPANVCRISLDSTAANWFLVYLFQPASSFAPELDVAKRTTSASPYAAGGTIHYEIVATNTGNVALSDVSIADPDAAVGACTPAAPATLAPGAALTCEAEHVVTSADMAAGAVVNTAEAQGTPPTVDPVIPAVPVAWNSNTVRTPVGIAPVSVPVDSPWALLLSGLGILGLGAALSTAKRQG